MAPKRKAVARPNKRHVKAKPSKKTTSDPKIAAKPSSTAKDVAPSVNPSIEVPRCSEDVPNTSNPERIRNSMCSGFSIVSIVLSVVECSSVVVKFYCVTKLRKYIVETNSRDDSVKLTNYGNFFNAIDVIRRKLEDDGVQAFKSTCFGHFLDMKSMTFCSAIVHSCLVRVLECDDPDVLEFNFRGIGARFDHNAFNLVTGLKFSQFPSLVETHDLPDTLWDKYFSVRGTLEQKEFMTKFERYPFDETDVKDNVKICKFYLLEIVLLAGDKRKLVCRDHFKIIQSPELRERYPWGSLSYDVTIKSLRSAVNNSNTSNMYSLCGFPLAFQYPVHNRLYLIAQEKKEAYITSFFRSIAYRSYDGPPSVVEDVDDTTVDPTSEQVQPDRRTPRATASTTYAPHPATESYVTSEDVARLENKLDDLNRKVQLIMQHLGIEESFYYHFEAHAPVMQKKYTYPSERSPSPSRDWALDMNDDTMTNYVKGILPLLSRSWRDVDRVYVPVNNENKYWMAAEVDLVRRHVTLYDSSCTTSNDWFQTCNAESLGVLYPYMLAAGGFYDERPELTFNGTPILDAGSMSRIDAALCPHQSSSLGDCGMFMLLCIDYLSAGRALDYLGYDRIF
ncbi:hypothetical protein FNV43_RR19801 [Rhamnella rubrinervis]|uniref:Ubiquitin-like protease family profile domain-containing protein n=1 Tax=Rhamnella rubrinervis TaxID=2594499 RepID=A0A8K0DXI2_9ROSA|nr:hypothetical protein FNV43_RR19801 [Rhamnella rubrinervis]